METNNDLRPEFMFQEAAAEYLGTTSRKIALFRKYKMLKAAKYGKAYCYKKSWLDEFAETWAGFDLSNESKIINAIAERDWRIKHGYEIYGASTNTAGRDTATNRRNAKELAANRGV